ncbi:MAG: glutathione peroxidase [Geminicoccaceae bacterium]
MVLLRALFLAAVIGTASVTAFAPPALADVHQLRFETIDGDELPLGDYRGTPLLVVNTASLCGFTNQYADMQDVWRRYRDRGLMVIGVPTDDFHQELDSNAEIKEFCEVNFAIDFPLTSKVTSRGPHQHPFFGQVATELGEEALPRWNFHKFLVDGDGQLIESWPSSVRPTDAQVTDAIDRLLAN